MMRRWAVSRSREVRRWAFRVDPDGSGEPEEYSALSRGSMGIESHHTSPAWGQYSSGKSGGFNRSDQREHTSTCIVNTILLVRCPHRAIALLNSGDLPTCYLAGVVERQPELPTLVVDLEFDTILFGDGVHILEGAHDRLRELVAGFPAEES